MTDELEFPSKLMINAFVSGGVAEAKTSERAGKWVIQKERLPSGDKILPKKYAKAGPLPDPKDWRHPEVGWGLVLPDNPTLSSEAAATAQDAPEPIQALVNSRGENGKPAPVLRYKTGKNRIGFLRRNGKDLPVNQVAFGTASDAVPRYLLIYGGPEQIPWQVQYGLNASRAVGRIALKGLALENYIRALMNNWEDVSTNFDAAVVWAADHGPSDITDLMRKAIAEPVFKKLLADKTIGPNSTYFDGSKPDGANIKTLSDHLASKRPGFILTTSHGMTGPLDNIEQMTENLGLLVDNDRALLEPQTLIQAWTPGGAVWYSHACCSAGSDTHSQFDGLVEAGSLVEEILNGVAKVGDRISPLPTALLGADQPLRAFIGHVEPTFDWTLQQPSTKQYTTDALTKALYDHLFQPFPVGLAMGHVYGQLGGIYADYARFSKEVNRPNVLYRLLIARDIQSTVILGDPTAMLEPSQD